jgi:hypothetical protein
VLPETVVRQLQATPEGQVERIPWPDAVDSVAHPGAATDTLRVDSAVKAR